MTIKERLREIRYIDERIDCLLRQIERIRNQYIATEYSQSRVQGGSGQDLSGIIVKIEEYENMINSEIDAIVNKKQELRELVDVLKSPYWEVINMYYFESGITWEQIAVKLNYSYPQIQWIHGRALRMLDTEFKQKVNTK